MPTLSKKRVLFLVIALLAVSLLVYAFLPKPVPVELAKVTRGPLMAAVRDDGRTRIKERYVVSAPLAGRLSRIDFKPGHPVREGETLLAVIEPPDPQLLDPRTLAEAKARVQAAEAARRQAQAVLDAARAGHEFAQTELTRSRELFAAGTLPRQELDRAQLAARNAEEELNSAQFGLRIAEFELEQARAALLHSGGSDARHPSPALPQEDRWFEIRSPITGEVLRVFQESTKVVTPGEPLLELGDRRNLEIEIDVLSTDAVRIRPGARVILEHWGGPGPLEAQVRTVEPAAFTKISALGVEEQRVWIIADFVSPPEQWATLGDAYRVEAVIVTWESDNVLKAPAGALFRQQEDWAVFVLEEGRARLRAVEVGERSENEAQILAGLQEGDQVIVHPGDRVRDGVSVTVRSTE